MWEGFGKNGLDLKAAVGSDGGGQLLCKEGCVSLSSCERVNLSFSFQLLPGFWGGELLRGLAWPHSCGDCPCPAKAGGMARKRAPSLSNSECPIFGDLFYPQVWMEGTGLCSVASAVGPQGSTGGCYYFH